MSKPQYMGGIGTTNVVPISPLYDFSKMKESDKSDIRSYCYQKEFLDLITQMFEYNFGETKTMDIWLLEQILTNIGCVGFCMIDGMLCYGTVSLSGKINKDGIPSQATIFFFNGESYSGTIGEDIVLMWNNKTHTPELKASQFSEVMSECDNSIMACVYNSRPYMAIVAKSQKLIKSIRTILKQWRDGKPQIITGEDTIQGIVHPEKEEVKAINLSDPTIMDKIQYLSKLHDDVLRRGLTYYGIPINSSGKMAQLNDKEIDGYETYSKIYPNNRLFERQKAIEKMNELFGISATVEFGLAFKNCSYMELPEDGEAEDGEMEEVETLDDEIERKDDENEI